MAGIKVFKAIIANVPDVRTRRGLATEFSALPQTKIAKRNETWN